MNFDIQPRIIDNVFSEEEYAGIYHTLNNMSSDAQKNIDDVGYIAYQDPVSAETFNSIRSKMEEILGVKLKRNMIHYARYTLKSNSKPQLLPHYDRFIDKGGFTLSVILDSTFDWDVYVEGVRTSPTRNQGVLFSGTHQVHWRPPAEFSDTDYYDILVCQLTTEEVFPDLGDDHREHMQNKIIKFLLDYEVSYPQGGYADKDWLQENYIDGKMPIYQICQTWQKPVEVIKHFILANGFDLLPDKRNDIMES